MSVSKQIQGRFETALETARLSELPFQHGVAIYAGSRLLGLGVNRDKSDPRAWEYRHAWTTHAEFNAILSIGLDRLRSERKVTLYSARIGKDGTPRMSRPCPTCMTWIKRAGIKRVVWYDQPSKEIKIANVKDL